MFFFLSVFILLTKTLDTIDDNDYDLTMPPAATNGLQAATPAMTTRERKEEKRTSTNDKMCRRVFFLSTLFSTNGYLQVLQR